ncbi:MAG: phosphoserine phosphatase SerB [Rhodobacterales bacterium 12-64-8]|nr:MAG: phosphoserine phosphatase SerB [Rhodobacterales bacterium 12-64-8]OYX46647.1 MAG: phosphoserine phosphatase SerB [Alphaproteobacteria bacterium 32-64-14]
MTEVLTLVSRAFDVAPLAAQAPGGSGDVADKSGAGWRVAERSVGPNADLVAWLERHAAAHGVDWAITPSANRKKRLLISDMDSTIIGQECLDELADFAGLKAEVSAITERAMRGELDFAGALTQRVAMLKGLGLEALAACHNERVRLNPGARELVATMKAHGARCVLVSGGFRYFTSRVAAMAGFEADRANTLIDDGARLTGGVGQPILGREAKLSALLEETAAFGGTAGDAVAMGDGANDLDMIKAAGLGVAYKAKPVVAAQTRARIEHTDLRAALFFQGYGVSDIRE